MTNAPAAAKQPHWTQTPAGRKKLSKALKGYHRNRKLNLVSAESKPHVPHRKPAILPEETFAYALGYVECWLTTYAASAGVPPEALTARMGAVLSRKAGRE